MNSMGGHGVQQILRTSLETHVADYKPSMLIGSIAPKKQIVGIKEADGALNVQQLHQLFYYMCMEQDQHDYVFKVHDSSEASRKTVFEHLTPVGELDYQKFMKAMDDHKQDFIIVTFPIVRIMAKKDVPLQELAVALVIPGDLQPPLCMVATKDPFVREDSWYVCDALVFDENDEEVTYTCKKVEQSFKAGEITMWSLQCIILAHMFDDSQPDIVAFMKMSQQKRASIAVDLYSFFKNCNESVKKEKELVQMFKKQDLVIKLMNDEKDDTLARKDYTRNETLIKGRITTGFDALMWNGTFGPMSSNSSNQNLHWKVGIYQSQQCTDLSLAEWLITFTNDFLKNQTIKQLQLELDDEKKKYIEVSEQLDSNDRLVQMLLQDISRMEKKASEAASQAERLESIGASAAAAHLLQNAADDVDRAESAQDRLQQQQIERQTLRDRREGLLKRIDALKQSVSSAQSAAATA